MKVYSSAGFFPVLYMLWALLPRDDETGEFIPSQISSQQRTKYDSSNIPYAYLYKDKVAETKLCNQKAHVDISSIPDDGLCDDGGLWVMVATC